MYLILNVKQLGMHNTALFKYGHNTAVYRHCTKVKTKKNSLINYKITEPSVKFVVQLKVQVFHSSPEEI
jgi:hypothetical protein